MTIDRFVHYKSGNDELDEDHLALSTALDAVLLKIKTNDVTATEDINVFLAKLLVHSTNEETCMLKTKFPFWAPHFEDHTRQRREIQELLAINNKQGQNEFVTQLMLEKLDARFVNHIDHFDLQLTQWLAEKYGNIKNFKLLHCEADGELVMG
jgi:hemerythrin